MEEKPVVITRVSEREIWVGEDRFYLGDDNIIYVKDKMVNDENIAHLEMEALYELANLIEGKANIFVDINEAGKPSSGARRIFQNEIEKDKYGKVAIFGMHPIARVMASFVISATNKEDFRFFKTKEDTLIWLKK